jgi:hypothetical protein
MFIGLGVLGLMLIFGAVVGYRFYSVWSMEMQGKAKLAEASQSRQIQVEQARGELEASKMRAQAIAVIGEAAQKYPEYRQQEFMGAFGEALREGIIEQIMYIPTEANIPITEANRLK